MTTVPRWDLAPKLDRPLSLWKPQDYALILYWVFFFPKAFEWYERTYYLPMPEEELPRWQQAFNFINTPLGKLALQSQLLSIFFGLSFIPFTGFSLGIVYQLLSYIVDWEEIAWRVVGGITGVIVWGIVCIIISFTNRRINIIESGVVGGLSLGVAGGVGGYLPSLIFGMVIISIIVFGLILEFLEIENGVVLFLSSLGLSIIAGLVLKEIEVRVGNITGNMVDIILLGMVLGILFGMVFSSILNLHISNSRKEYLIETISLGGGFSIFITIAITISNSLTTGIFIGITFFIFYLISYLHLCNYVYVLITHNWALAKLTPMNLPKLRQILVDQLEAETSVGLHNVQELLIYGYQYSSVQEAIKQWLVKTDSMQFLPLLCDTLEHLAPNTTQWFLDSEQSNKNILRNLEQLWRKKFLLYRGYTKNLRELLENSPELMAWPFAPTLYQRVKALDEIWKPDNIQEISHWYVQQKWLEKEGDETFRPQFLATLRQLHHTAGDVHIAQHSLSKLRKTAALGRASGDLQSLEQNLTTICSPLEQKAVLKVIRNWQKVVTQAAGQAGQLEITKPVENPFVVGAPVSGALFVGREDIFHQLEEMWGDDPGRVVDSVVLYGQRRMGKTSILQNIGAQFGAKTVVAFFNLQRLGRLQQEGELWSELAFTIYEALQKEGLASFDEPNLEQFLAHPTFEMNRFVAKVRPVLSGRRLILALDEFEELEKKMLGGEISEGVIDYVRSLIHTEPWLVVVLAGLHTLNEMTHNYWHPLFASVRPIRVSFLSEGMVEQLLANPHEDFPLDISREAAGFVHQWTAGQPLLVQLTGSRLVRLYNQILFEQGVKRSEQFTVEDVQAVMFEPEFFIQGSGYFQGVWGQTEPGLQQQLLQVLARLTHFERPQVAEEVLWERLGCTPEMGQEALAALQQRDIVRCTNGLVGFTVPLLRYWVGEVRRG